MLVRLIGFSHEIFPDIIHNIRAKARFDSTPEFPQPKGWSHSIYGAFGRYIRSGAKEVMKNSVERYLHIFND